MRPPLIMYGTHGLDQKSNTYPVIVFLLLCLFIVQEIRFLGVVATSIVKGSWPISRSMKLMRSPVI